ncbi:MAG: MMPL family transporter [Candidatus Thiodiazotropha sp. (ex Rostrolucina anterorostrata)]|nr:MMPL family transporter [Candidatus Thiodiazotropha sp. (ex Rostrolucina anterorostrata)]
MDRFTTLLLRHRLILVALIGIVTLVLGYFAWQVEIRTIFTDLQPSNHPYVQTNDKYKKAFGGVNVVSIMVEVEQGDIFQHDVLATIQALQKGLQHIDAVNQFQIISLASKKLKSVAATSEGFFAEPLMWPGIPQTQAEIDTLRAATANNPMANGNFVSSDLKAALVTVDFIDRLIDYNKVYPQLKALIAKVQKPGMQISLVGQPVLAGIVIERLPETFSIVIAIVVAILVILLLAKGTVRGMLLPLFSAAISCAWALGIVHLLGVNLDPLAVVITFLISARAVSHAVQLILAFDAERAIDHELSARDAARIALRKLFRPGLLGLATDAGAMAVVALTPIPLLQKAALIGALWLGAMVICTIILVPVLLSWTRVHHEHRILPFRMDPVFNGILEACSRVATEKRHATMVVFIALFILVSSGFLAKDITIGDANPGSPILWPDSAYNQNDASINERFPGSDRMFLVVAGTENDVLKNPGVLDNISRFQQYIEAQPEVGGTMSLADVIRPVNMLMREGNPRFFSVAYDQNFNAELLFLAMAGSDPGDVDRFTDYKFRNGAIQAIEDYAQHNPMEKANFELAGGLIGVLAAVNEVIFSGQLQSIALALLILFIFCAIAYKSPQAGLFFLPLVLLSNTITFAFMAWHGIGLNINTLPVAALGIGLGVDYAFYIADRVKERFESCGDLAESIRFALSRAGRGVIVTALTMVVSVILWFFLSSLRFQAEMGMLIALWMTVSAITALIVIPSMIYLVKPSFLVGNNTLKASHGANVLSMS